MQRALAIADWLNPSRADYIVSCCGGQPMSLSVLRQQVQALCSALRGRSEQRWALCFEDSYLFTAGLLAALHAGKTVIIPGHCRPSLLQEQSESFDGVLSDLDLSVACAQLQVEAPQQGDWPPLPAIKADAEVVLFTSGSTGKPRQVHKPLACLDHEAQWLAALWGERLQGCWLLASVTHQHMYGLAFRIILPMALGLPFASTLVLYSEQLTAQPVDRHYAFISSPAFLRRLDFSLTPPSCKLIVSAGGALPAEAADGAGSWFGQVIDEIYGSTETGVLAWRSRRDAAPSWHPFNGVRFSRDAQQRWHACSALIPQREGLMLDDKLAFDADGNFQLCGRHDRVVKIEDKRISLSDIERRLLAIPEITDAVALQVARHGRSAIGVVLVLAGEPDAAQLTQLKRQWKQELQRWLEPVAMPRFWRVVKVIPHNSQSKRAWPQIQELFYAAG
ncbi:acyl-coenzyme A synthetase/AMP-(fatty) acid ligase [Erwinia toletana]|uniref:Acyl-coenzyme A synthetase/AMP-(Fatty) acid ligase n=1 Tax=Winslowiella toletana TaxID=92490 RepID=A0ABS4PFG4_9GAMM|nr:AMP-binding protein [Winslowiella toletana]MBP2170887.1 acyl-coenzyme A synthetase/AMP-(fatty) acid ligase [Winslowiella toletana]